MKKCGMVLSAFTCIVMGVLLLSSSDSAQAGKDKPKLNAAKLKIIINKIDPEIKAAQKALQIAKNDLIKADKALQVALTDEVLNEKGATEVAALDRLKASRNAVLNALKDVNIAIKQANLAQLADKSGD